MSSSQPGTRLVWVGSALQGCLGSFLPCRALPVSTGQHPALLPEPLSASSCSPALPDPWDPVGWEGSGEGSRKLTRGLGRSQGGCAVPAHPPLPAAAAGPACVSPSCAPFPGITPAPLLSRTPEHPQSILFPCVGGEVEVKVAPGLEVPSGSWGLRAGSHCGICFGGTSVSAQSRICCTSAPEQSPISMQEGEGRLVWFKHIPHQLQSAARPEVWFQSEEECLLQLCPVLLPGAAHGWDRTAAPALSLPWPCSSQRGGHGAGGSQSLNTTALYNE